MASKFVLPQFGTGEMTWCVRALPELRGRVRAIDLNYWSPDELEQIALVGYDALNVVFPPSAISSLAEESAGSPQLMQLICLNSCYATGVREKEPKHRQIEVKHETRRRILEQTTPSTDFRSLVDVLDAGPKTRGTERKIYKFTNKSEGDVYRCIMSAVAANLRDCPSAMTISRKE